MTTADTKKTTTYQIFQSVNFRDTALGYRPGAEMRMVWEEKIGDALSDLEICEMVFTVFQRVDEGHMPPDGFTGRSLSIGDVVRVRDNFYACAFVGFEQVEPFDGSL